MNQKSSIREDPHFVSGVLTGNNPYYCFPYELRYDRGGHDHEAGWVYLRVSRDNQTTDKRRELEGVAARSGWDIVGIFEDAGITGAKGQGHGIGRLLNRPQDQRDRGLVRGSPWPQHAASCGISYGSTGVEVGSLPAQKAIDTTTPYGRAMFQMCGVFAEFERAMIVERVTAGLARAKANGIKLGRGKRKDDEKRWRCRSDGKANSEPW